MVTVITGQGTHVMIMITQTSYKIEGSFSERFNKERRCDDKYFKHSDIILNRKINWENEKRKSNISNSNEIKGYLENIPMLCGDVVNHVHPYPQSTNRAYLQ